MTDDEAIGRLIRHYDENGKHIAALRAQLSEASVGLLGLAENLTLGNVPITIVHESFVTDLGKSIPFDIVDYRRIATLIDELKKAQSERSTMETCLKQAGLDAQIRH